MYASVELRLAQPASLFRDGPGVARRLSAPHRGQTPPPVFYRSAACLLGRRACMATRQVVLEVRERNADFGAALGKRPDLSFAMPLRYERDNPPW